MTWPADFIGSTCGANLLPSVTGSPITKADDCDQIAVTYEDTDIPAQSGGCKQILRKWIIVDLCQFKPNVTPRAGYWEYTQNIKITNNEPPTLSIDCKDITVGLDDKDCLSKKVNMIVTATDDCSDATKLNWTYKIDLGDDGNYDRIGVNGDISGDYPIGKSYVYISISDGCGNIRSCTFRIHVVDVKKPTAVCHHGLSVSLMASGMVPLTATMFNGGSFDNCTAASDLAFKIIPEMFTCKNLGPNLVTFTVTDKSGNVDFCTTYVDIQDNMKMCTDSTNNKASIAGAITNTANVGVEKVDIMVNGAVSQIATSNVGNYLIYKSLGLAYVIKPEKHDEILNGVSTFDIVKLSKHILGTDVITNPYALVAADVNKSTKVTTADVVALRKVILGINKIFAPNQGSWRFVKKDYVFPTILPLETPFPESHQMTLDNNMTSDFIAVKIGDINGNAKPNSLTPSGPRGISENLVFSTDDILMEAGKTYRIPLIIKEKDITGVQFTLKYNDKVTLTDIQAGDLADMTSGNFAVIENGTITASWNSNQRLAANATFATLTFKASATTMLSEVLQLNSEVTAAEAYSTDEELKNVVLQFNKGAIQNAPRSIELYQNQPNPFSEVTEIRFYLPESTSATISLMDITGKVVYQTNGEFSSGIQTVILNKSELSNLTSGVFYYKLQTNSESISKKMIMVE